MRLSANRNCVKFQIYIIIARISTHFQIIKFRHFQISPKIGTLGAKIFIFGRTNNMELRFSSTKSSTGFKMLLFCFFEFYQSSTIFMEQMRFQRTIRKNPKISFFLLLFHFEVHHDCCQFPIVHRQEH